ncbi:MAG: CPBP family intramembrane metalloprotease [Rhodothermales bacterium]|nr:CPBP family intramembrane metalloprotease [Rhodothermales bacterium]
MLEEIPDLRTGHAAPYVTDEWRSHPIPLDGRLERAGFPPWLTAGLVLFMALILFQVVVAPIATFALLLMSDVGLDEMLDAITTLVTDRTSLLLVANTIGQVLALAVPTLIIARLHSSRSADFLRLREADYRLVGLAVLGLAGLFPLVQWLGELNAAIPVPDIIREFERLMIEPIERMLSKPGALGFNIAMIALTPAICEEILFRGYVQRQVERTAGVLWGIAITGIVFGAYHLQITKIIPLSVLGIYLGYITWRSGSIIPAVIVHFANNAAAILIGTYAARSPDMTLEDLDSVQIPWYFLVAGFLFLAGSVHLMNVIAADRLPPDGSGNDFPLGRDRGDPNDREES